MTHSKMALLGVGIAMTLAAAGPSHAAAADFSPEAIALPFPPDARELEFTAWAGDIEFSSSSSLKSLAAFYLKEMAARGWEHDESKVEIDDDSIELTFQHGKSIVELRLSQWSKEVKASLDCENLSFTGVDDPAKLAAAGIPVPPAALFLQKEITLPEGAKDLQYTGDGCMLKSPLALQEAFDYFSKLVQGKGFRESRRPILTSDRRYTEFKKGAVQFSVNVFTDEVGSRIILTYQDPTKQKSVPPLAAVASLPLKGGGDAGNPAAGNLATGNSAAGASPAANASATPIDVASNKGSATVSYAGRQYTFANVACFQTKRQGSQATMVVFSAKPIPVNKMQVLIATKDDFSFGDLYEFSAPERLILQLGDYLSFTFALSSTYVGNSIDNPVNEMKQDAGRVRGTMKMPAKEIFRGEQFSFTASVDAAIITPTTRIAGPGDAVEKSDSPLAASALIPFPAGAANISSEGSKFRKTYSTAVSRPLAEVTAFYRQELAAKGLKQATAGAADNALRFQSDALDVSISLTPQGDKTAIKAVARDSALARSEGILPEPGKGRIVLANASGAAVAFTIGRNNYPLRANQGAKDFKQALNYSVAPAEYTVIVRIPGQQPQTEKIDITAGSAWGIIALPTGGYMPMQLY